MREQSAETASFWTRLIAGLVLVWAVLQGSAMALHSFRGEAGLMVGFLVLMALLAAEWFLFKLPPRDAEPALGLGGIVPQSILLAAVVSGLLLLYFPVFSAVAGVRPRLLPGWGFLAIGLLVQGGFAEEALFRGYLFRRIRERHPFWRAAWLSMLPFTAVHLLLFITLPAPIAAASVLLAIVTSFPLARLFELGRGTVWAPALVHGAIQSIKLFQPDEELGLGFSLGWMVLSALVPLLVFLRRL